MGLLDSVCLPWFRHIGVHVLLPLQFLGADHRERRLIRLMENVVDLPELGRQLWPDVGSMGSRFLATGHGMQVGRCLVYS